MVNALRVVALAAVCLAPGAAAAPRQAYFPSDIQMCGDGEYGISLSNDEVSVFDEHCHAFDSWGFSRADGRCGRHNICSHHSGRGNWLRCNDDRVAKIEIEAFVFNGGHHTRDYRCRRRVGPVGRCFGGREVEYCCASED